MPRIVQPEASEPSMIESIHQQLVALKNVPAQLGSILESVVSLQAQLAELAPPATPGPTRGKDWSPADSSGAAQKQDHGLSPTIMRIVIARNACRTESGSTSKYTAVSDPVPIIGARSGGLSLPGNVPPALMPHCVTRHRQAERLVTSASEAAPQRSADPRPTSGSAASAPHASQSLHLTRPMAPVGRPPSAGSGRAARVRPAPSPEQQPQFVSFSPDLLPSSDLGATEPSLISTIRRPSHSSIASAAESAPPVVQTMNRQRRPSNASIGSFQPIAEQPRRPSVGSSSSGRSAGTAHSRGRLPHVNFEADQSSEAMTQSRASSATRESLVSWALGSYRGDDRPQFRPSLSSINSRQIGPDAVPGRGIWLPNSRWRLAWDLLITGITTVSGVIIPIRLTYFEAVTLKTGLVGGWLHFFDACWAADIIMNFRTAFFARGILVVGPSAIAKQYMRSWLLLDLLAAVPFVAVPDTAAAVWAVSVLKLLRLFRLGSLILRLQKCVYGGKLTSVRVIVVIALLSHVMSCCWRLALRLDEPYALPGDLWWKEYILDTYWLQMTMTTVGYGDVSPRGTCSYVFAILAMVIAPIFFGAVVSVLGHFTRSVLDDDVEKQVVEALIFMQGRRVSVGLQRRVDHNLRHHIRQERQILSAAKLLGKLSPAVQRELALELLSRSLLKFPLFRGTPHAFSAEIAHAHVWAQCLPGDLVVEEGQLVQEVVFIIHGRLIMMRTVGMEGFQYPEELELESGAWFGEACLFQQNCLRSFTAYAATESELAVLPLGEYERIVNMHPHQKAHHDAIQRAIQEGRLDLSRLACRPRSAIESPARSVSGWLGFLRGRRTTRSLENLGAGVGPTGSPSQT